MIALAILALSFLAGRCHARGDLPDSSPACTPGAVDATVTRELVCASRARERRHVAEGTKRAALAAYGLSWADRGSVTLDHRVPIELGGAPDDARNLWPENPAAARAKDVYEGRAHRRVCAGTMTLEEAQKAFLEDWRTIR